MAVDDADDGQFIGLDLHGIAGFFLEYFGGQSSDDDGAFGGVVGQAAFDDGDFVPSESAPFPA